MCAHTEVCWLESFVDLVSVAPTAAKRMAVQDTLQKLWLHGKVGGLCAREQLKAWALREAWMDGKPGTFGMEHVDCREAHEDGWRSANKRRSEGAAGQDRQRRRLVPWEAVWREFSKYPNLENQEDANLKNYFAPV